MTCTVFGCANPARPSAEHCRRCSVEMERAHFRRMGILRELSSNGRDVCSLRKEDAAAYVALGEISIGLFWWCPCGAMVIGSGFCSSCCEGQEPPPPSPLCELRA